jgi:hypothetical protein
LEGARCDIFPSAADGRSRIGRVLGTDWASATGPIRTQSLQRERTPPRRRRQIPAGRDGLAVGHGRGTRDQSLGVLPVIGLGTSGRSGAMLIPSVHRTRPSQVGHSYAMLECISAWAILHSAQAVCLRFSYTCQKIDSAQCDTMQTKRCTTATP